MGHNSRSVQEEDGSKDLTLFIEFILYNELFNLQILLDMSGWGKWTGKMEFCHNICSFNHFLLLWVHFQFVFLNNVVAGWSWAINQISISGRILAFNESKNNIKEIKLWLICSNFPYEALILSCVINSAFPFLFTAFLKAPNLLLFISNQAKMTKRVFLVQLEEIKVINSFSR